MKGIACITLTLAFMAPAVWASELVALIDLPVAGSALVPKPKYCDVSSRAASTGSPVDMALGVVGAFAGMRQLIVQTNAGAETPSASRVTVIRDGLLDDAVRTLRWDISLARTVSGPWEVTEVRTAWRCWRGDEAVRLTAKPCP